MPDYLQSQYSNRFQADSVADFHKFINAEDFDIYTTNDAATNTANLRICISAAVELGIANIRFPVGDIYLDNTTPIDLTEIYQVSLNFDNPTIEDYSYGLHLSGQGIFNTRLRVTTGGTLFRVYPTTQNMNGTKLSNLSIFGPNSEVISKSSCGISSGSNVVTISDTSSLAVGQWVYDYKGSMFPVGSYISAITTNTSITISSKTTASPPVAQNQNASGTDASGVLAFYTDSCAIQFGGVATAYSNILELNDLDRVGIFDFFTGVRGDDITNIRFLRCFFAGNKYHTEAWYNTDLWMFDKCRLLGYRHCDGYTGTTTNSSATISSLSTTKPGLDATHIPLGAKVANWTTPAGFVGTERVYAKTATSVTMSGNHAASGGGASKTLTFHSGVVLAIGAGPWRPGYNGTLGTPNAIRFTDCQLGLGLEVGVEYYQDGLRSLRFTNCYTEGLHQLARLSYPAGGGSNTVVADNCHFSTMDSAQGRGWVECIATSGSPNPVTVFNECNGDGTMNRPMFYVPNASSSSVILTVKNCTLPPASTVNIFSDGVFPQFTGWFPSNGTTFAMGQGAGIASGVHQSSAITGSTPQWQPRGMRRHEWTLTGNATLTVQATNTFVGLEDGDLITFVLTQNGTGGYTFTFSSTYFFKSDGSTVLGAAGVISSGTASQKLSLTFVVDKSRKRFIRCDGDNEAWT